MSMSDEDWSVVAGALCSMPSQHAWTPSVEEAYRIMLAKLTMGAAMKAILRYAESGEKWRPTWADLLRLSDDTPKHVALEPGQAWELVETAIRLVGVSTYDERFPARHQAAIDWLRGQDEATAAWAAQRGLCGPRSLGHEPVSGTTAKGDDIGGAVMKRLGDEYGRVVTQAAERQMRGLEPFGPRAFLVRGTEGRGGMKELVAALRPDEQRQIGVGDGDL